MSGSGEDIDFTAIIADLNNEDGWPNLNISNLAAGTSVITTNPSLVAYCAPSSSLRMTTTTTAAASSTRMMTTTTAAASLTSSLSMVSAVAVTLAVTTAAAVQPKVKKTRKRRALVTSAPKVPRLTGETVTSSSAYVLSEGDRAMDLVVQSASTSSRFRPVTNVNVPPILPLHHDAQVWTLINDVRALKRLVERQSTLLERYADELRDVKADTARLARGGRVTFH